MARDLISRYIWIVDTLNRYGHLTRADINRLWMRSALSDGKPMPERTFFHHRRAIEENFNIDINCDSLGRYYIDDGGSRSTKAFTNMLLDSLAVGNTMREGQVASERIDVEEVPSAREFLAPVAEALRQNEKLVFTYAGFNRSRAEKGIVFHPYFMKRYKQRWYMVGLREKSGDIRTYALDRVRELRLLSEPFEMPADLSPDAIFGNIIGVTTSKAPVRTVKIMATTTQAKYLRALPLHPSQSEELHDDYSIFTYQLKLNYELVHELLGYGDSVKVLSPPELRAMVTTQLTDTLALYGFSCTRKEEGDALPE